LKTFDLTKCTNTEKYIKMHVSTIFQFIMFFTFNRTIDIFLNNSSRKFETSDIIEIVYGKNDFAEVSKNFDGYGSENNFVGPSK